MLTFSWRSMVAAAGIISLSILATSSYAADLGREDEIAIRGDIVAVDPTTRMIIVDSAERDTLGYQVLPNTGDRTTGGDIFGKLKSGMTIDMRYYRIIDVMVAKATPDTVKEAAAMIADPAKAPGILNTGRKVKVWQVKGMVVRTDMAAKKMDIVDRDGGMVYRTPWIKSKEGQATLASLKPGDNVVCVFTQRTAFDVTPVN
jgi:hypothetical protein